MPKNVKEERLRWVLTIINNQIKLKDAVKVCPYSQRSLERWVAAYKQSGEAGLEPKSTRPKTQPYETSIAIKEQVIELRKQTKLCAQKLHWRLLKQGIKLHPRTIGKILKTEKLVRKYHVRKIKYKYIKTTLKPGELIEIDIKFVPGIIRGKRYFQYTAIDCASRWRYLDVYDDQSNYHALLFLKDVIQRFPYQIKAVKTDNGAIFTNYYMGTNKRSDMTVKTIHAFDQFCRLQGIIHYLIDPGKPAQNGTVERSHRSDQEAFYDRHIFLSFKRLKLELRKWNMEYNNLEHCGLNGQSPNEYLKLIPPNVYS